MSEWLARKDLLRPASSLGLEEKKAAYGQATATRVALSAYLLALGFFEGPGSPPRERATPALTQGVPLLKTMKRIRREADRLTHDVPLALSQQPASPQALKTLRSAATGLYAWAVRLAEDTRMGATRPPAPAAPLVRDRPTEPDAEPGTYIMVLQSGQAAIRRIGRLDTFWLPAGYYLYIGSACGAGGVASRTNRYGQSEACRMWNLDHVKAVARPVEVWWTHHSKTRKVECPWALALPELPGYFCPAPRFGGNDCKSCPAHFYHTLKRPSCEAFAAVVQNAIPGHGPIYRHRFR